VNKKEDARSDHQPRRNRGVAIVHSVAGRRPAGQPPTCCRISIIKLKRYSIF
jgi:hypothetical protein